MKFSELLFHSPRVQEVFGDNKWTWFLPVSTSLGDGTIFPTRISAANMEAATSYQSVALRMVTDNDNVASVQVSIFLKFHLGRKAFLKHVFGPRLKSHKQCILIFFVGGRGVVIPF
jgi:hypothetical protein